MRRSSYVGIVIIAIIITLITSLIIWNTPHVNMLHKLPDDKIEQKVKDYINKKYNESFEYKLLSKENATTLNSSSFWYFIDGASIEGAYKYTYLIIDNKGNEAYVFYKDEYSYHGNIYESYIEDTYELYKYNYEEIETSINNIVKLYINDFKTNFMTNKGHDIYYNIYLDCDLKSLNNNDIINLNLLSYDLNKNVIKLNNARANYLQVKIKFNDTDYLNFDTLYGIDYDYKKSNNLNTDSINIINTINTEIKQNITIDDAELNKLDNTFLKYAYPYINKYNNVFSEKYDNKYVLYINTYTKNNNLLQLFLTFDIDKKSNKYKPQDISIIEPGIQSLKNTTGINIIDFEVE